MPIDPEVKQWLQELKESACAAKEIAQNYPTGMGLTSVTPIVQLSVLVADTKADTLLDPNTSPSFTPPDAGSNFEPIDMTNAKLPSYASTLKDEACEALDEYCLGNDDQAGQHVRRLAQIIPGYQTAIGAM